MYSLISCSIPDTPSNLHTMSGNAIIIALMAVTRWTKCTDTKITKTLLPIYPLQLRRNIAINILQCYSSSSPQMLLLRYQHLIIAMCSKLSQLRIPRGPIEASEVFQFVPDTKEIALLLLFINQSYLFLYAHFFYAHCTHYGNHFPIYL